MDHLRRFFGVSSNLPPMSVEQSSIAERQRRIADRQAAIDLQVDALALDRRDARRQRH